MSLIRFINLFITYLFIGSIVATYNGGKIGFKGFPKFIEHTRPPPLSSPLASILVPQWSLEHRHNTIHSVAKKQSAIMAEEYLKNQSPGCIQKDICQIQAGEGDTETKRATRDVVRILSEVMQDMSDDQEQFPLIASIVASFSVGVETQNITLCNWLFTCELQAEIEVQPRTTCQSTSKICPVVGISCGLCAIVAPDTCGSVCPLAAIYCGTSGLTCVKKPPEDDYVNISEEEVFPTDDIVDEEDVVENNVEEGLFPPFGILAENKPTVD